MKRVVIFGPSSWDTVIKIGKFPENGGFAQGLSRLERPGGAGLNIASAVASSGVMTKFHTYVGKDLIGMELKNQLLASPIQELDVQEIDGASLHAVITIDEDGERTIFALERNRFSELDLKIELSKDDIVVFPVWRGFYTEYLRLAQALGCFTVAGLNLLPDSEESADLVVGSEKDVQSLALDFDRCENVIVTAGLRGARIINASGSVELEVKKVNVVDATGAGDSFLSGVLVGLAQNRSLIYAGKIGINWATQTVQEHGSLPAAWRDSYCE